MSSINRLDTLRLEKLMSILITDETTRRTAVRALAAALCAASLTWGAESSAGSPSTPVNAAPTFIADSSVLVRENTTSTATSTTIASFEVRASDGNAASATASFAVTVPNAQDGRYIENVFAETIVSDDIRYATVNGRDLVLNVITPVGDTETRRPFVLLATGGAFAFTQRAWSIPIAERFARAGYVAAVMDYRTRGAMPQGAEFRIAALEATHDMLAAVRFMRANASTYGIDPDMFVVGGTSAGAVMAIAAGTMDPDDPMTDDFAALMETMGGVYGNVGEHLDQSSSVQGVFAVSGGIFGLETIDADSAPIYAVHNELDPVAPCGTLTMSQPGLVVSGQVSGACDFIPAFERRGVPAGSFIVPGDTGHVAFANEEWARLTTEALLLYKREIIDVR